MEFRPAGMVPWACTDKFGCWIGKDGEVFRKERISYLGEIARIFLWKQVNISAIIRAYNLTLVKIGRN